MIGLLSGGMAKMWTIDSGHARGGGGSDSRWEGRIATVSGGSRRQVPRSPLWGRRGRGSCYVLMAPRLIAVRLYGVRQRQIRCPSRSRQTVRAGFPDGNRPLLIRRKKQERA